MSVIRVNKSKNYTIMSNTHFKERKMSLKAKGLLSLMLSLPDNWDYTIEGLIQLNKDNESSIKSALDELKDFKYLVITKKMPNETDTGRIEYVYDIYEEPYEKQEGEKQDLENLGVEFLGVENQGQSNTNNKDTNNKDTKNIFKKPTLEEVEEYCKERNNNVNPIKFLNHYEAVGWVYGKSRIPVKDWKACVRTWESESYPKKEIIQETTPEWFNEKQQVNTQEDEEEFCDILSSFK